jgi:hypothetical protein
MIVTLYEAEEVEPEDIMKQDPETEKRLPCCLIEVSLTLSKTSRELAAACSGQPPAVVHYSSAHTASPRVWATFNNNDFSFSFHGLTY